MTVDATGGKHDLPTWVYRAGLGALACILIWQASETLTEVRRLNERQVGIQTMMERFSLRLDWHDKAISDHGSRLGIVESRQRYIPGIGETR